MDKSFDRQQLSHMDSNLRVMVEKSYDLCIYNCNLDKDRPMMPCKQSCFKNIQVPFRHASHVARDGEENAYRKCLAATTNFPNVTQEDFISCSNNLFEHRIETLSNHMANEAERVFRVSRS